MRHCFRIDVGGCAHVPDVWNRPFLPRYGMVQVCPWDSDADLYNSGNHHYGICALATGLFASKVINPDSADGLFFGNPGQIGIQLVSAIATIVFAFVMTSIILKVIDMVIGFNGD